MTQPADPVLTGQSSDAPREEAPAWGVPALSSGAPEGARTLEAAPERVPAPEPATPEAVSGLAANGIPNVALNAYRVAAARLGSAKPGCGIDWSLLAGIGRVESNHGRFGGATLNADGTSSPEIRGPALDGGKFAYIGDSDDGRYDHDTVYDRAVGSMQFIPTTWRSYAVDGDGNGTTDPFDIDDAALGAAHYLCVAGGNLRTEAGLRRAVLAYNHSNSYVDQVLALARAYASGIPVDSLPLVGDTSGSLPEPRGFYRAPASPGPAIGSGDRTQASGDTVFGGPPPAEPPPPAPAQDGGSPPAPAEQQPPAQAGRPAPAPAAPAPPPPPAPKPAPAPAPANPVPSVPLPQVPLPAPQLPSGSVPSVPEPVAELVPGVTCSLPDALGLPLLPDLPLCPK
ncbi:lytic transglycosylase [Blastococcus saxobsidens]|uniref:Lytic transglycosylase n=1 Tax=Blastococcus saxobsidens TaxID=138336 RepID=A0A6L9W744_9ACTN|nr:lytic transglycosylase domain-containing protein [Blastococcus saxobsidens]NEK87200.1 lytic transglycosylase [Blastococcus saxobsidens]